MPTISPRNFASDGLTLRKLVDLQHRLNGFTISLEVTAPFPSYTDIGNPIVMTKDEWLTVQDVEHDAGMAYFVSYDSTLLEASITDIERCTRVLGQTLAYTLDSTDKGDTVDVARFNLTHVRTMKRSVKAIDTAIDSGMLDKGEVVMLGIIPELPQHVMITADGSRYFPMDPKTAQEVFASKLRPSDDAWSGEILDLTIGHDTTRRLYTTRAKFRATTHKAHRLVYGKGAKIQVHRTAIGGLVWGESQGKKFVIDATTLNACLDQICTRALAVLSSRYSTHRCTCAPSSGQTCWSAHTYHNSVVTSQRYKPANAAEIWNFSCTLGGLPLPPPDYIPPVSELQNDRSDFGHFVFSSDEDKSMAANRGLLNANHVMHETQVCYGEGLSEPLITWVPGTLEGSQAPFGNAPAHIHLWLINFRRKISFGKDPVPSHEVAVYTGSDEFWLERPGADGSGLQQFQVFHDFSSLPTKTEAQVEADIVRRQGYSRGMNPASGKQRKQETLLNAHQQHCEKNLFLRACSRHAALGFPAVLRHTMNPHDSLARQTSFHSDYFDLGQKDKMHPVNYQLYASERARFHDFMNKSYPRRTADGEPMWRFVLSKDGESLEEVMLLDIPCMPSQLAASEDQVLLAGLWTLGIQQKQIVAHMDVTEYPSRYPEYYGGQADSIRRQHGLSSSTWKKDKEKGITRRETESSFPPITPTQLSNNNTRGRAPGLIDPTLPRTAQIMYEGQVKLNWIDYPDKLKASILSTLQKDEKKWLEQLYEDRDAKQEEQWEASARKRRERERVQ